MSEFRSKFLEVYSWLKSQLLHDPAFEFTDDSRQWVERGVFVKYALQEYKTIPPRSSSSTFGFCSNQKSMDHKPDHKVPRPNDRNSLNHHHKMSFTDFTLEDLKQTPHLPASPPPRSRAPKTASAAKGNCLCSPTTHIGSFRCRYHRHDGMFRGGSVGSNLSDLARKSEIMGTYSP